MAGVASASLGEFPHDCIGQDRPVWDSEGLDDIPSSDGHVHGAPSPQGQPPA
jgi:hypothetical protein